MARQFSDQERRHFATALKRVGLAWQNRLQDEDFYSLDYFDLFTEIWLREGEQVIKTDCYRFMSGMSRQTAKKYVQRAIERGHLIERDNPRDKRSKLISLSPRITALVEQNFDHAAAALRKVLRRRPPMKN
jgi:hypothetical protein